MKLRSRRIRGQGMTEYIIIVALIAIAAIAVYSLFGDTLRSQTGNIAAELGGGKADHAATKQKAEEAKTKGNENAGLDNFGSK